MSFSSIEPPLPIATSGHCLACWRMGSQFLLVHENGDYRWMYFSDDDSPPAHGQPLPIQSIMRLSDSTDLVLPYMQRMVAWLACFSEHKPLNMLQLGLGGGAIARWVAQLPAAHCLTSVDSSVEVIRCYQHYFEPDDTTLNNNGEHTVIQADAAQFLTDAANGAYDFALVDLYDRGLPASVESHRFCHALLRCLSAKGLAIINVAHGKQSELQPLFNSLRKQRCFLRLMVVPGFANILVVVGHERIGQANPAQIPVLQQYLAIDIAKVLGETVEVSE